MPFWCGVGITVITQPAVNGERGGGICFNRNTDLRREEKLENSDANPTFQEQHDCKYSLSRPKRQADYMHHVETFTKSIKVFVFKHYFLRFLCIIKFSIKGMYIL